MSRWIHREGRRQDVPLQALGLIRSLWKASERRIFGVVPMCFRNRRRWCYERVGFRVLGVIYQEPDLRPGETIQLRLGAGFFPSKALLSRGGLLYVTDQRLVFQPHKLDSRLGGSGASVDFRLDAITAVGTTPRWWAAMGRRFLRVDASGESYLFLFSVRHPTWRQKVISSVRKHAPSAIEKDGWGTFA